MIMDTLAALALATELPYPELLDEPPHGRHEVRCGTTHGIPQLQDPFWGLIGCALVQQACQPPLASRVIVCLKLNCFAVCCCCQETVQSVDCPCLSLLLKGAQLCGC